MSLTAGSYQQIRVILLDNNQASKVSNNKCGNSAANCIVLAADSSVHPLQLSSESQTGIKIPSGQLSGGKFQINAGEAKDLNIDFNACASIVIQANGQYRLKPVLHAGEVSLTSSSVSGKIVDSQTLLPISGGKVVVALEQLDTSAGIDRVIMETVADGNGNFVFCPVPAGSFDVVAVAIDGSGVQYAATITTGVQAGNALSQVLLHAQAAPATASAAITGKITTSTGSAGAGADLSLSALQTIAGASGNILVTIPQAETSSATLSLATATGATCPANTDCASYTVKVPAVSPYMGGFTATNQTYTQSALPSDYTLDVLAFVAGSGNTADCTPPEQKSASITVASGTTTNAADLIFTGCQ